MKLRACHISDTHDVYQDLNMIVPQDTQILFFTGDLTYKGKEWEMLKLCEHFKKLSERIPYIVGVLGNHELGAQGKEQEWKDAFKHNGAILLDHESIEIEGMKIFGSPWTPWFFDWAYNYTNPKWGIQGECEINGTDLWKQIPDDTQILLTHGPPDQILDHCKNGYVGCVELKDRINQLQDLRYHMFGHIHSARGMIKIDNVLYSNAAIMNEGYKFVYEPNMFDLTI